MEIGNEYFKGKLATLGGELGGLYFLIDGISQRDLAHTGFGIFLYGTGRVCGHVLDRAYHRNVGLNLQNESLKGAVDLMAVDEILSHPTSLRGDSSRRV